MRIIYLSIGFISLALAYRWSCLATITNNSLPFILSIACFSKSSKRFEDQTIIPNFIKHMLLTLEKPSPLRVNARKIIVSIYILMEFHLFSPLLPVKIALGCLTIFITYYLFKVIPDEAAHENEGFIPTVTRHFKMLVQSGG